MNSQSCVPQELASFLLLSEIIKITDDGFVDFVACICHFFSSNLTIMFSCIWIPYGSFSKLSLYFPSLVICTSISLLLCPVNPSLFLAPYFHIIFCISIPSLILSLYKYNISWISISPRALPVLPFSISFLWYFPLSSYHLYFHLFALVFPSVPTPPVFPSHLLLNLDIRPEGSSSWLQQAEIPPAAVSEQNTALLHKSNNKVRNCIKKKFFRNIS